MEANITCQFYLLQMEDTFAVQYLGPDPEHEFLFDMDGMYYMLDSK